MYMYILYACVNYPESSYRYEGAYLDDKKHGHGIYTWTSGGRYTGEWNVGKKHGHGVYNYPDGSR